MILPYIHKLRSGYGIWLFTLFVCVVLLTSCAHRTVETSSGAQVHSEKYIPEEQIDSVKIITSSMHAKQASIWPLLTNRFVLKAHPSDGYYRHYLNRYKKNPHFLEQKLRNAPYYLHYILREIKRRNMPAELALLPVIESQYEPFAYSYAKAGGMWQIMPQTAKHLDLSINWWYDERRDIRLSTHAALNYLEELHAMFDDWILAIAAYNAGPGTVRKAIKAQGSRNFWRLNLPKQTQDYVPKLLAIAHVVKHHKKFAVQLPAIANKPYFLTIELEAPVHLKGLANAVNMPFSVMERLNAGYNQWVTPPNRTNAVTVPYTYFAAVRQALRQDDNRAYHWLSYQVRAGDSLTKLAGRYHTNVEDIQAINHLKNTHIRQGQYLLLPVAANKPTNKPLITANKTAASGAVPVHATLNQVTSNQATTNQAHTNETVTDANKATTKTLQLAEAEQVEQREQVQKNVTSDRKSETHAAKENQERQEIQDSQGKTSASPTQTIHQVKKSETLWSIGRKYGVSIMQLVTTNHLESTLLQVGQMLIVPLPAAIPEPTTITPTPTPTTVAPVTLQSATSTKQAFNMHNIYAASGTLI